MQTLYLNSFDSTPLFLRIWDDVAEPKGLVIVCHDAGEHSGRYEGLAEAFNAHGLVVLAYDMRAFGTTARPEQLGKGDKTLFEYSLQDVIFLYRYYQRKYQLPIFLLGQGYGGYLAVGALERGIIAPKGVLLLSVAKLSRQGLVGALSMAKSIPLRDTETTLGIPALTHLTTRVDGAVNDPLCNVTPNVQFDIALAEGLLEISKPANLNKIDRTIHFALFEGMKDPALGKEGQDAVELLLYLRELGWTPRFFGYEDAAHDLLTHPLSPRYFGHMLEFIYRAMDTANA